MGKPSDSKKIRKPKPIGVGTLRARAIRGPREGGIWYWRIERYQGNGGEGTNIHTGWYTTDGVLRQMASLVAEKKEAAPVVKIGDKPQDVGDLLDCWLAHQKTRLSSPRKRIRPRTLDIYEQNAQIVCDRIGTYKLSAVDAETTEQYWRDRTNEGASERTTSNELTVLCAAWNWGRTRKYTPDYKLPSPATRELKDKRDNDSVPTLGNWWKIVDAMEANSWQQAMARMLEATGARVGEISPVEWSDLDVERKELHIRISKTGARNVPVSQGLIDYLHNRTPEEQRVGRILLPAAEMTCRTGFRRHLEDACAAAEVKYFAPKQIRHLSADRLYRSGVDPKTAGEIMGHSDITAMKYYRKVNSEDRQRAQQLSGMGERPDCQPNVVPFRKSR